MGVVSRRGLRIASIWAVILAAIVLCAFMAQSFLRVRNERAGLPKEVPAAERASLSGVVTGCYGGPVTDALVALTAVDAQSRDLEATTDATGGFLFQHVPMGRYSAHVTSVCWGVLSDRLEVSRVKTSVSLQYTGASRIVLSMMPGFTPPEGCEASISLMEAGDVPTARGHIQEDLTLQDKNNIGVFDCVGVGEFVVSGVVCGRPVREEAVVSRNGDEVSLVIHLAALEPAEARDRLRARAFLGDREHPIRQDRIRYSVGYASGGHQSGLVSTDGDGWFEFGLREASMQQAMATFTYEHGIDLVVELPPNDDGRDLELVFVDIDSVAPTWGIVLDVRGGPVPYAAVSIDHGTTGKMRWADADGIVDLAGIAEGDHKASLSIATPCAARRMPVSHRDAAFAVVHGQESVIEVDIGACVVLKVVSLRQEDLTQLAAVFIKCPSGDGWRRLAGPQIRRDGGMPVALQGVKGECELVAKGWLGGQYLVGRMRIDLTGREMGEVVVLEAKEPESVIVGIRGPGGEAVEDAWVVAAGEDACSWAGGLGIVKRRAMGDGWELKIYDGLGPFYIGSEKGGLLIATEDARRWKDGDSIGVSEGGFLFGRVLATVTGFASFNGEEYPAMKVRVSFASGPALEACCGDSGEYCIEVLDRNPTKIEAYFGSKLMAMNGKPEIGVFQTVEPE